MFGPSITPADDRAWEQLVRGLLKAHLKLAGMGYADLVDALADLGVSETEPAVRAKINRGRFTAIFMLQCLRAMRVPSLPLPLPLDPAAEPPLDRG